jgi:hypothetical protein
MPQHPGCCVSAIGWLVIGRIDHKFTRRVRRTIGRRRLLEHLRRRLRANAPIQPIYQSRQAQRSGRKRRGQIRQVSRPQRLGHYGIMRKIAERALQAGL